MLGDVKLGDNRLKFTLIWRRSLIDFKLFCSYFFRLSMEWDLFPFSLNKSRK